MSHRGGYYRNLTPLLVTGSASCPWGGVSGAAPVEPLSAQLARASAVEEWLTAEEKGTGRKHLTPQCAHRIWPLIQFVARPGRYPSVLLLPELFPQG